MSDFDVRCEKAKEMLRLWMLLVLMPADDESKKEESVQCKNKIFALLSDPLQVGIEQLLTSDEQSYAAKLDSVFKLACAMYGDDALDKFDRATFRSVVAQKKAIVEHRREVRGGWSPRPEVLNR